jgi:hypothetical protein
MNLFKAPRRRESGRGTWPPSRTCQQARADHAERAEYWIAITGDCGRETTLHRTDELWLPRLRRALEAILAETTPPPGVGRRWHHPHGRKGETARIHQAAGEGTNEVVVPTVP